MMLECGSLGIYDAGGNHSKQQNRSSGSELQTEHGVLDFIIGSTTRKLLISARGRLVADIDCGVLRKNITT
jgi:hypothetical protein